MNDKPETKTLTGFTALITGGAHGIGAGICRAFAAAGANVAIIDLDRDGAQSLADEINGNDGEAIAVIADIAIEESCLSVVAEVINVFGGFDILVNCAAPRRNKAAIGQLTKSDWSLHEQIVLSGPITLAEAAKEYLEASGRGSIINISSVTGESIALDQCSWPYHVSKAGLDQLTRYLAAYLGGRNIRCNAIAPGLIDREVNDGHRLTDYAENLAVIKSIVPLGRAGTAYDVAQAAIFLGSEQSSYITGQVLTIDGGLGVNEVFGAALRTFKLGSEFRDREY